MFGASNEFDILRKMVVVFGSLFANVSFGRIDQGGNQQIIHVPLTYIEKDKLLQRVINDPGIEQKFATELPRLSFQMGAVSYDPTRKLESTGKSFYMSPTSNSNVRFLYNPVPYNVDFQLHVYVKNAADGTKIVENIFPYFTPDWTAKVELVPEVQETRNISIILRNVQLEDIFDGKYEERRVMVWTLSFTMKTYFYAQVHDNPVITFQTLHLHSDQNTNSRYDTITLTSNALPNAVSYNVSVIVNTNFFELM